MKVFARYRGEDDDLDTGEIYIIYIDNDGYSIDGILVTVGGGYKYEYDSYKEFKKEWELV